nr:hypothetical protein [uncultured Dysosmobacter sp.]
MKKLKDILFWTVLAAIVVIVVGTPIHILRPRPLTELVDTSAPLKFCMEWSGTKVVMAAQPETPEMEELRAVLDRHSYHLHWSAVFGSTALKEIVLEGYRHSDGVRFSLAGPEGDYFHFNNEFEHFWDDTRPGPNGQGDVVCLDYWGDERGGALRQELMAAVGLA